MAIPILILVEMGVVGIIVFLCVETTWVIHASGWEKVLAWVDLALVGVPLLIAGLGGWILGTQGLAWRSCVKLPCGFAFVGGLLLMLAYVGFTAWRFLAGKRAVFRVLGRGVFTAAVCFLFVVVGWYGVLFSAIWAGSDRVIESDGRMIVAEHCWMDDDYYEYHSGLIRGANRIFWG